MKHFAGVVTDVSAQCCHSFSDFRHFAGIVQLHKLIERLRDLIQVGANLRELVIGASQDFYGIALKLRAPDVRKKQGNDVVISARKIKGASDEFNSNPNGFSSTTEP